MLKWLVTCGSSQCVCAYHWASVCIASSRWGLVKQVGPLFSGGRIERIFTLLVFVTQFGDNYARIYSQLIVIYIIYTLLQILQDPEASQNTNK